MSRLKYLNPQWLAERRHLLVPYTRSYSRDIGQAVGTGLLAARARLAGMGLGLTANDRRMAHFRNIHAGQKAFVLGNGPSLRVSDLDRLSGQITFACNNIFVAFTDTTWRPTYYAVYHPAEEWSCDLNRVDCTKFLPVGECRKGRPLRNAVYFRNRHRWFYPEPPGFSTDMARGIYWGGTVTYILLQLAYHMGIRKVYLLGVDHDYGTGAPVTKEEGATPVWTWNFHPNYYRAGTDFNNPSLFPDMAYHLACWTLAYQSARKAFESAGGRIYNATRGGKLDVFPRVDFDSIILDR